MRVVRSEERRTDNPENRISGLFLRFGRTIVGASCVVRLEISTPGRIFLPRFMGS